MFSLQQIDKIEFEKIMKRRRIRTYVICVLMLIFFIYMVGVKSYKYAACKNYCKYLINMDSGNYDIEKFRVKREEYEKKINIQNIDYDFNNTVEKGNRPRIIILHHTAEDNLTPENINVDHKKRGYGGIGYHFYIRRDGEVYRGRPEEDVGAHTIGRNFDSIGICLEGNFQNDDLNEEQEKSLIMLMADMIIKYNIAGIEGHKDAYPTLCPGKNISIEDIKEKVVDEIINIGK